MGVFFRAVLGYERRLVFVVYFVSRNNAHVYLPLLGYSVNYIPLLGDRPMPLRGGGH